MMRASIVWVALVVAMADVARAQDEVVAPKKSDKKDDVEYVEAYEEPVIRKTFTRDQVRTICKKYDSQLIAYYGDVWQVLGCERRPIVNNKTVYNMQRSGFRVQDVDGDIIAAIPEGEPLDHATSVESARGCKELEGRYITYSNTDVYFVARCKKRIFPDWTSYIKHRESREDKKGEILSLSWIEFEPLADGEPMKSVFDDLFGKMVIAPDGVDTIPVDEACDGVDGQVVSYYSRLYKIERCKKREIGNPELFFKRNGWGKIRVTELSSEQWISLPNGAPIETKEAEAPKASKK